MVESIVGRIDSVVLAQFGPDEDLLGGLREVARREEIRTGVVMTITGGLTEANVGYFAESGPIEKVRMDYHRHRGPFEVSGHGMIGLQEDGDPYVHVHVTLTCGDLTVCGHIGEGCLVRSLIPTSHFTVFIARIADAELHKIWEERWKEEFPEAYPNGAPSHRLVSIS